MTSGMKSWHLPHCHATIYPINTGFPLVYLQIQGKQCHNVLRYNCVIVLSLH
jgi:hypothetical protein